jgi:uncharacterized membrane protein
MTHASRLPLTLSVLLTRSLDMTFLAWNLGLAAVALGLVVFTLEHARQGRWWLAAPAALCAWLFFPNTIYLVSDLAHANYGRGVMRWCDTAMVGTFGLAGAMLAVSCLERVREAVAGRLGETAGWSISALVWITAGVGVWMGRVPRWNSWDALLSPVEVVQHTLHHFAHPLRHPSTWATALVYGALCAALQIGFATHALGPRTTTRSADRA